MSKSNYYNKYKKYKKRYLEAKGNVHYISFINDPTCPLLDYIKSGEKTVEGRKNSPQYQSIKVGDTIIFKTKGEDDVKVKVEYVHKYKTLEDYLINETVKAALPCVKTVDEGVKIYNKWSSLNERNFLLDKYGYSFLGIGIKKIH